MTDIDIDFAKRDTALIGLRYVSAVLENRNRHASGVYFQNIPVDPLDGMAVWDHTVAAAKGYFKIDFLNLSIYQGVRDHQHLTDLLRTDPPWEAFEHRPIVERLAQISKHYDTVQTIKPRCIDDLAVCIALIRPGKTRLIGRPRHVIDQEIWLPTPGISGTFKKSHSYAYAASIIVQLNLLLEQS